MKKFLIIIAILFLTACSFANKPVTNINEKNTKPKIPILTDNKNTSDTQKNNVDMNTIIKEIDKNIDEENITQKDIERGWYYAKTKNNKKTGTPSSWIWVDNGDNSKWMSDSFSDDTSGMKDDKLCKDTGGTYSISCIEKETASCEYISKSKCNCALGSKWISDEGCIAQKNGQSVKITTDELKQGWYYGSKSEKKSGTPQSWVFSENGSSSKWKSAGSK